MNWRKGLFRIYIVWDVFVGLWVLLFLAAFMFFGPPSGPDELFWLFVAALVAAAAAPWALHYLIRWIVLGFKGGRDSC